MAHRKNRAAEIGRNRWTRSVDAAISAARTYAPPVHWVGSFLLGLALFVYMRLLVSTTRVTVTEGEWPSTPSVLAIWHGAAASFLVAVSVRRLKSTTAILVGCDPRGDALAWLCRMLKLTVVRGDATAHGYRALEELATQIRAGASAIITADGLGPVRVAKAGAVSLAAAAGVPLVATGAECRPSLTEKHKWDAARNPLPFGRIVVAIGPSLCPIARRREDVRECQRWLQEALEEASDAARRALVEN